MVWLAEKLSAKMTVNKGAKIMPPPIPGGPAAHPLRRSETARRQYG
jgi:hypothetical protein